VTSDPTTSESAPPDLSTFGKRLEHAKRARGMSATALEKKAQVSKGIVGRYERGERSNDADEMTWGVGKRLAHALDVPVPWLLDGDGPDPFAATDGTGSSTPAQAGA
jgi:transcriptional regulator with XRE-family HTH domain